MSRKILFMKNICLMTSLILNFFILSEFSFAQSGTYNDDSIVGPPLPGGSFEVHTTPQKFWKHEFVYEKYQNLKADIAAFERDAGVNASSDSHLFPALESELGRSMKWGEPIVTPQAQLEGPCESYYNFVADIFLDEKKGNVSPFPTDVIFKIEGVSATTSTSDGSCSVKYGLMYRSYNLTNPIPAWFLTKVKN